MKIFKRKYFVIVLFSICKILSSCVVENAKIPKNQFVIIFSDCLHQQDEKLFTAFKKRNNIKVKIIYLETDSLIKKIKNEGLNTNADLIILKSIVSIAKTDKLNLLQPIKSSLVDELIDEKFQSRNNTWYGIGIDPYLLIVNNKVKNEPEKYFDLLTNEYKNKWSSTIQSNSDLTPFISSVFRTKKRSVFSDSYKKYLDHELYLGNSFSDIFKTNYCLTYYSTYVNEAIENEKKSNLFHPLFLNQTLNGSYFNMHCAAIVKQAKNYENAKLLLEYISSIRFNEIINNVWKTIPISLHKRIHPFEYQNIDFTIYKGYISKQVLNYKFVNKLIQKNQKSKIIEVYYEPVEIMSSDTLKNDIISDSLNI